jgi:hypothetical protein
MELFVGGFSIDYLLHVLILRNFHVDRQTDRQTDRPSDQGLMRSLQSLSNCKQHAEEFPALKIVYH